MTKILQGKKVLKFRDRIMGTTQKPETESNTRGQKIKYSISQEILIQIKQTTGLNWKNPNPRECVGKVETDMIF